MPPWPTSSALFDLDAQLAREQRVVAQLRVRVEREVVRRERDVGVDEHLQAPFHRPVDDAGVALPEEAVMDDDHLGFERRRMFEELA